MVGELPIDGECSVCGGELEKIKSGIDRNLGSPDDPKMYHETWEIKKCTKCGHIEKKKLLNSEKLT
ncbi:hypothetical protein [Methanobacterium sp. ACI-7]|uniref:hypothetical protein n=1 Tax=unclassified Methanobacterium TaxID=2627676 RepID=UPI0039C05CF7